MLFHFPGCFHSKARGSTAGEGTPWSIPATAAPGDPGLSREGKVSPTLPHLIQGNRSMFLLQISSSSVHGVLRWLAVFAQVQGSWEKLFSLQGPGEAGGQPQARAAQMTLSGAMLCPRGCHRALRSPESPNPRIAEVGRHLWRSSSPTPAQAGSPRADCPRSCPGEF